MSPRRSLHPRALVIGLAAGLAACSPALEKLPGTAQLTCATSDDCPDGWFCQSAIGKCVRADSTGAPPDVVGAATFDHTVARAGTAVTVSFTVSTDLAAAPLVELTSGAGREAFGEKSHDGRSWAFVLLLGQDAPEGQHPVVVTLIGANGAIATDRALGSVTVDSTAPSITRIDPLTRFVAAGQTATVEVTFGEPVAAPLLHLGDLAGTLFKPAATAQATVWRFTYVATGAEAEGDANVAVEVSDAAGNARTQTEAKAFAFDFTKPGLAAAPEVATAVVRPGQQAVVRLTATEVLAGSPTVELVGKTSGTVLPLAVAEAVGARYTFGRLVLDADPTETYDVRVRGLADPAGNAGADVIGGTLRIDATAPSLTAGPTLDKPSGQYRAGEKISVTFTASEDLQGPPSVHLTTTPPLALPCTAGANRAWACQTAAALTGAEVPATALNVLVELVDLAGNVGSASGTAVLDFTPPGAVAGSIGLTLVPPSGALVPSVTALGTGGAVRVTFTADEPLSVSPAVATTTPEALPLALTSQAGTTYTYEATLSGAHAQGAYALQATLTDRAGNVGQVAITGGGRTLTVDTAAPASPGVNTASLVVFDRVPWGTPATSNRPSFKVTGGAGAVEGTATVIALDGAASAGAVELGRTAAAANGSFSLALPASDRTQVWILAVDGAGNASGGGQAVRVRDVTWTASLTGKVPESVIENPHVLEARSRWLGAVQQGGSTEKALPADTTGALAWNQVQTATWPAAPAVIAQDPLRGRLVAFRNDGTRELSEFDGSHWTTLPFTGGPKVVQSAVFDPRRAEVVVYADPCDGGWVLWSWNGARWKALGQGVSWTSWLAGGLAGPGPHKPGVLTLDERTGDLYLSMGYWIGDPLTCGDQAGQMDLATYRFDGTAFTPFAGATGNGSLFGYDPARGVVVRRDAAGLVTEWNGAAWSTITMGDPEGDGNPAATVTLERFAWDPLAGRLVALVGGTLWQYTGSSFKNLSATPATAITTDHLGARLIGISTAGLYAGSGGLAPVAAPATALSPVGLVWNATAHRMELFDGAGAVYRWSQGTWVAQAPVGGVAAPTTLSGACAYPGGGAFACGAACYQWTGTAWSSNAAAVHPNLVYHPGLGVLGMDGNARIWRLSGSTWTAVETNGDTPYWNGDPEYSPALGGLVHGARSNPFSTDNNLYRWTGSGNWTIHFSAPGYGLVRPIAADGANRTFALHDFQTTYAVNATAPPVQVAGIDNPYAVDFPTAGVSAWSPDDQAVFLASGSTTYRLETEGTSRPGHLFRFSWPASGGPDLRACLGAGTGCQITRVDLAWSGVATGDRNTQTSNATLQVLDGLRFTPVASGTSSGVAGVASLAAAITDRNLIGRLAFGPGAELVAATTVASGTLTAAAQLRTDSVTAKVTYRLP